MNGILTPKKSLTQTVKVDNNLPSNLEAALDFRKKGWYPTPLCWTDERGDCDCGRGHTGHNVGKAPLFGEGYQNYHLTPHEIREETWRKWPKANVGILNEPSGLMFIGPDTPTAAAWVAENGVPPTAIRISRNSGYIYARPEGCPTTTVKHDGGGPHETDIKTNGYFVAYGLHQTGCPVYVEDLELSPAPSWAVEMLTTRAKSAALDVEIPDVLPTVEVEALAVAPWVKQLIYKGRQMDPARYPSRSEPEWAVLCQMVKGECDDATIAGVMMDPRHLVGEKAREQGIRWLGGEIGRARANAMPPSAPPPAATPDTTLADAGMVAIIDQLRAELAETRAELAEVRALQRWTVGMLRNESLRGERVSLVATTLTYRAAVRNGKANKDGFVKTYLPDMAAQAGVSTNTYANHLGRFAEWGVVAKQTLPIVLREVDKETGEVIETPTGRDAVWIKMEAVEIPDLDKLVTFQPPRQEKRGGRREACPDHPDAAIVKRAYCAVCNRRLPKLDTVTGPISPHQSLVPMVDGDHQGGADATPKFGPYGTSSLYDPNLGVAARTNGPEHPEVYRGEVPLEEETYIPVDPRKRRDLIRHLRDRLQTAETEEDAREAERIRAEIRRLEVEPGRWVQVHRGG